MNQKLAKCALYRKNVYVHAKIADAYFEFLLLLSYLHTHAACSACAVCVCVSICVCVLMCVCVCVCVTVCMHCVCGVYVCSVLCASHGSASVLFCRFYTSAKSAHNVKEACNYIIAKVEENNKKMEDHGNKAKEVDVDLIHPSSGTATDKSAAKESSCCG